MSENIIAIYDASTGELSQRPMTQEEISETAAFFDADKERIETNQAIKASALSKLAALGLTEEEIAAL